MLKAREQTDVIRGLMRMRRVVLLSVMLLIVFAVGTYAQRKPKEIRVGIINGRANYLPAPVLSKKVRASCEDTHVKVEVIVDMNGRVVAAQAVSGQPVLYPSAVKAAKKARFSPSL